MVDCVFSILIILLDACKASVEQLIHTESCTVILNVKINVYYYTHVYIAFYDFKTGQFRNHDQPINQ